jgi:hypothetical protein
VQKAGLENPGGRRSRYGSRCAEIFWCSGAWSFVLFNAIGLALARALVWSAVYSDGQWLG